jgi:hypothetical protein
MPEANESSVEAAARSPRGAGPAPGTVGQAAGGPAAGERILGRLAGGPGGWIPIVQIVAVILLLGLVSFLAPIRAAVVLLFALTCPGIAIVRQLGLGDPLAEIALGIATSVALGGLISGLQLYLGAWSPRLSLVLLLAITCVALVAKPIAARLAAARRRGAFRPEH